MKTTTATTRSEGPLPMRDPEKMGALLLGLEPRMSAVALRFTRDPDAARDVVQSAFEKVLRHGGKFRGEARVSTWAHRIVANEALMWLRSQRRRHELRVACDREIDRAIDPAAGPHDRLEQGEHAQRLQHGLAQLTLEENDIVRRCSLEGQTYAEYAAHNGLHAAAVKSRAFRARRRLELLLRD